MEGKTDKWSEDEVKFHASCDSVKNKLQVEQGKKKLTIGRWRGIFFPLLNATKLGPENAINKQLHLFTS